jgi:type II secretory pathway component PulF
MQLPIRLFPAKISLEKLTVFCGNLATCLAAGLDVPTSLRTGQAAGNATLRRVAERAARETAKGASLADALESSSDCFPAFFVPVIRCGEQSGRIDETLRYLERHCRLLAGPARSMRNTWLMPLCIMLAGSAVCAIGYALLAPLAATVNYVVRTLTFYSLLAAAIWCILYLPAVRPIVDGLRLVIPGVGQAERDLAINRFFHAMSLLYSTGGLRVERMIRLAADSAGNAVLRVRYLPAAAVIEAGGTISEAFRAVSGLPADYTALVVAGEEAGKLETAFDTVSRRAGEAAEHCLTVFQKIFIRVCTATVVFSVYMTLSSLAMLRHD